MMQFTKTALLFLAGLACVLPAVAQEAKPAPSVPTQPAAPLREAQEFYLHGDFEKAVARYNDVLQGNPQSAEAYSGIVRSYLKQNRVGDADSQLQKALQVLPSDSDLKVVQGELLFRQGRIPEAEKTYVELINSGHASARAYLGLAHVSAAIAMYAREHRFIGMAHQLDPGDPDIKKQWMATLSRPERIQFLESYLEQPNGDDAEARRHMTDYLGVLKAREAQPYSSCRLVSDVNATETELLPLLADAYHLRGLGLPVIINGQKSKLMLDTGAGGIVINRKLASRAGVQKIAGIHLGGIGDKGEADAYAGHADSIRVGNLEFRDCTVEVVERRSVAEEEGLIGADVFQKFLIELDFPSRKMSLRQLPPRPGETPVKASLVRDPDDESDADGGTKKSDEPAAPAKPAAQRKFYDRYIAPEMSSYTRVYRFGHMLFVPTKVNENPGKLFLIDSGAWNNAITPDAARAVTKLHERDDYTVKGISGKVNKVYEASTVFLEFGGLRQKHDEMVAFDFSRLSRDVGTEVSGTLGFAMLNLLKIKLDYRDALVTFEYVPDPRITN